MNFIYIMNQEEQQYLDLIKTILNNGTEEISRNGKVFSVFGNMMRFSLKDGQLPLLTTKKVAWKTCFKELLWFIKGSTSNHELKEQNVQIWNANASREFLDSRNLTHKEDDLGPVYGHQWRHFNADYENCHTDYKGKGVDQLEQIIQMLKDPEQRTSRRMVVSAWNPCQLDEMALPPCHIMFQFYVRQGKYLSCSMYQRSGDVGLGVPFNIASYSLLTHIIAKHCGLIADEFVYFLGNAHIYEEHITPLKEQIKRIPLPFPKIKINKVRDAIEEYTLDDIEWMTEYTFYQPIKMNMVA
jgi:thymidylate synthase